MSVWCIVCRWLLTAFLVFFSFPLKHELNNELPSNATTTIWVDVICSFFVCANQGFSWCFDLVGKQFVLSTLLSSIWVLHVSGHVFCRSGSDFELFSFRSNGWPVSFTITRGFIDRIYVRSTTSTAKSHNVHAATITRIGNVVSKNPLSRCFFTWRSRFANFIEWSSSAGEFIRSAKIAMIFFFAEIWKKNPFKFCKFMRKLISV